MIKHLATKCSVFSTLALLSRQLVSYLLAMLMAVLTIMLNMSCLAHILKTSLSVLDSALFAEKLLTQYVLPLFFYLSALGHPLQLIHVSQRFKSPDSTDINRQKYTQA